MSFIANKGMRATNKEAYQTNKGYETKSVLVDEKMYLIHIPNQNKSKEYKLRSLNKKLLKFFKKTINYTILRKNSYISVKNYLMILNF